MIYYIKDREGGGKEKMHVTYELRVAAALERGQNAAGEIRRKGKRKRKEKATLKIGEQERMKRKYVQYYKILFLIIIFMHFPS
jgi:hypothetical protein